MLVLFLFVIFNVSQCAEKIVRADWVPTISRLRPVTLAELDARWCGREKYRNYRSQFNAKDYENFHTMRDWLAYRQSSAMSEVDNKRNILFSWILCAMLIDNRYISVDQQEANKANQVILPFDLSAYQYYLEGDSKGYSSLFEADLDTRYPERALFSESHLKNVFLASERPSMECRALTLAALNKSILYIDPLWDGVRWVGPRVEHQILVAPRKIPHFPSFVEMQKAFNIFKDASDPDLVRLATGCFLVLSVPDFAAHCIACSELRSVTYSNFYTFWFKHSTRPKKGSHLLERCKENRELGVSSQHAQIRQEEYNDLDKILGIAKEYLGASVGLRSVFTKLADNTIL
ncbi:MAG: hypothetical protein OXC30_02935 [Alphaproteobacteria bacterium]|nr:hypothetical protein [Alphaproteobacteria bacterium]